eukprot:1150515-Pelagomonas_calceolata.AAC.5
MPPPVCPAPASPSSPPSPASSCSLPKPMATTTAAAEWRAASVAELKCGRAVDPMYTTHSHAWTAAPHNSLPPANPACAMLPAAACSCGPAVRAASTQLPAAPRSLPRALRHAAAHFLLSFNTCRAVRPAAVPRAAATRTATGCSCAACTLAWRGHDVQAVRARQLCC